MIQPLNFSCILSLREIKRFFVYLHWVSSQFLLYLSRLLYKASFLVSERFDFDQFIVCLLILFAGWATDQLDKNSLRLMILNFAQGLMIFQLTVTFLFQVAYVQYEIVISDMSMICDMFGFLLHNLKTYQVILHLLAITLSI